MTHRHPRRRRRLAGSIALCTTAGSLAFAGSVAAQDGIAGEPNTDQYVAEYADARFEKRGTELQLAPGVIDDRGAITEVLEASVYQQTCQGRFLVTIDVSASAAAPDLEGVEVAARAGYAKVEGTFTLTGDVTLTPAGRGCQFPIEEAATTAPLTTDVAVSAYWKNLRGSVPVVYSGSDCGGDGICYYRDARAHASWSSDFIGDASARSSSAFFFEGTYSVSSAALALVPSLA